MSGDIVEVDPKTFILEPKKVKEPVHWGNVGRKKGKISKENRSKKEIFRQSHIKRPPGMPYFLTDEWRKRKIAIYLRTKKSNTIKKENIVVETK